MPRKTKKIPTTLSEQDLNKILYAILTKKLKMELSMSSFFRTRNAFMIYFQYWTGFRPKEARRLKIEDIDVIKYQVFISGENNKQRQSDYHPIPEFLIDELYKYLLYRNKFFKDCEWLFPDKNGRELDRGTHIRFFRQALKDAGLYKVSYIKRIRGKLVNMASINLYSLRHSYGTMVFSRTKDLEKTGAMLRHRDFQLRSTLRYIHTMQNLTKANILKEIFPL